jgi:hypothetical protein
MFLLRRKESVFITVIYFITFNREIIAICSENYATLINKLFLQNLFVFLFYDAFSVAQTVYRLMKG